MSGTKDFTLEDFGDIKAIRRLEQDAHGRFLWLFRCRCGNEFVTRPTHVRQRRVTSCGCLGHPSRQKAYSQIENYEEFCIYNIWLSMRQRCRNSNRPEYPRWGGRGITICPEWNEFEKFRDDMGSRPSTNHSLDRIDNDGNYEPLNCKWSTPKEQANNRRNTPLKTRLLNSL